MLIQGNNLTRFYFPETGINIKIRIAYFLGKLRKSFPIEFTSFKTNFISNSKAPISELYYISEGILNKLKNNGITEEDANRIYPHAVSALNSSIKLYKKVKAISLYLDHETINMAEKSVDNYYEIESLIRRIAYKNKPIDKGDGILNEFASKISQHSLFVNEI